MGEIEMKNPKSAIHIPFDLLGDRILPRLPAKSLIRFTSVCKKWYSFIKSHDFFAAHLYHNQSEEAKCEFPIILDENLCSCYVVNNQESVLLAELCCSFQNTQIFYRDFVESCNGLILIEHKSKILLWNPSIKKYQKINTSPYNCTSEVYGLGFHESSNDHRVVRIVYTGLVTQMVEVYSLGTNSWHRVNSTPTRFVSARGGYLNSWIHRGKYLNECVHWISVKNYLYGDDQEFYSITSFDFESELFHEMSLPKEVNNGFASSISLVNFEGSFAVLYHDDLSSFGGECEVWRLIQMTEYGVKESWTKKFSICFPKISIFPVGFMKNGMLVYKEPVEKDCAEDSGYKFVNMKTGESTYVKWRGNQIEIMDYVESLALL